jgi:hypothetical protein
MLSQAHKGVIAALLTLALWLAWEGPSFQNPSPATQAQGPQKAPAKENPENEWYKLWDWFFHDATGVFTCLLVLVAGGQFALFWVQLRLIDKSLGDARRAANAAEAAADVAQKTLVASQRAWIRIDQVELSAPLTFNTSGGAGTSISIKLTNIGNAPALLVRQHAWLLVSPIGAVPAGELPTDVQKRLCEGIKTAAWPMDIGAQTVFPQHSLPGSVRHNIGINAQRSDIERALESTKQLTKNNNTHVPFLVVGCVDYSFPTDPNSHHQTRFLLQMQKNPPFFIVGGVIRGNPIVPEDGQIPAEALMLLDFGTGDWAD